MSPASSPVLSQLAREAERRVADASDPRVDWQLRRRLRAVSGTVALSVLLAGLALGVGVGGLGWTPPARWDAVRGCGVGLLVLSSCVGVLSGWGRLTAEQVRGLCTSYQLLGAAICAVGAYGPDPVAWERGVGVSWLGGWILLFGLLGPVGGARNAFAAALAVVFGPLAYGVWAPHGGAAPSVEVLAYTFGPNVLWAGLAVFPGSLSRRASSSERALGTYRLVERLGRGGTGEVWRAQHQLLRRPAAIKVVVPRLDDAKEDVERLVARFEREANSTAQLRSPHTVQLYDFGTTEGGAVYLVMELLEGVDLQQYLERYGAMELRRAVHVLGQVCCSLVEAHRVGMIHRDVKPANVFLCRQGEVADFVKVLDFGLVTFQERGNSRLTAHGMVLGTPECMAPEQIDDRAPTFATDVYAWACLAFHLLAGRPVFEGASPMEVVAQHLSAEPPRLRARAPEAPEVLEALVGRCLAKEPEARPTMSEVLAELRGLGLEGWRAAEAEAWWAERESARQAV